MDTRVRRFRAELRRRVPERGVGKRIPKELRVQAVALIREGMAEGRSQISVARQLGLRITTVRRWMEEPVPAAPRFHEVRVSDDELRSAVPVLVLPNGIRVEGLDLDGIVELLRRLS